MWKRLGRKKCTGRGYNTTLTVTGSFSHPRSGRRASGILFGFIVNFTTYVKSLIHECFVCNSPWKRQLSIELLCDRNTKSRVELLCDRNTKSRVRRIVFTVERSSSFRTGQRKRRGSKQRATSWHSRGGVTNSYNWNGVQVRTLLMLRFIVKLFLKNYDKRVSTEIFQRY